MTKQEHEMMLLMFVRMQEAVGIVVEALKSRELWTADDVKAFSHATHYDDKKMLYYVLQARADYLRCAKEVGVVTGLET
jgi:hypothetical protein